MKNLYLTVLKPLLNRVGTAAAVLLVSQGADAQLAEQVATGIVAVGLIAVDLALSWKWRKEIAIKSASGEGLFFHDR